MHPDDSALAKPKRPTLLANLDPDLIRSPSYQTATEECWLLAVRGHGILSISVSGVRLLQEPELQTNILALFGRPLV
jgi:hypothetical protein